MKITITITKTITIILFWLLSLLLSSFYKTSLLFTGEELTICYADTLLPTNVRSDSDQMKIPENNVEYTSE